MLPYLDEEDLLMPLTLRPIVERLRLRPAGVGLALALLAAGAATQAADGWTVVDGSAVRFVALQQGAPVEGEFAAFEATIAFDPEDLAGSRIEVVIDATSITTGHKDRDLALRSPAFFDVAQFPTARFVSQEIVATGENRYDAKGELTIRDVTQPVVLPFSLAIEPAAGGTGAEARAEGELAISRLAYGVGQGEWAATATVADEVKIRIAIVATSTG
jgi:polyisoprenoid-binding protein YceI